ncbi:MAG: alkaline shock response membrane anchor protein AmaP [Anaerolineae bacterium]|jgi:3-methyladenine DNA glycosylase/8-oxoguanine DNA glycosylase
MNTFNRVVLVILLLLAMGICSLALVLPVQTLSATAEQADALADLLDRVRPVALLPIGIFLALIVDLVGVLLIILEVRRPAAKSITVQQTSGGEVTLSIASIVEQLKSEVGQLPEVLQTKPKVSARRKGVLVEVDAKIEAEAGLPNKAERIVETVRHVVEHKMGLKLVRPPKVNLEAVRRTRQAPPAGGARYAPPQSPPSVEVTDTESSLS